MTIYAGKGIEEHIVHQGNIVPSAAVWMQDIPSGKVVNKRHVRTIDCSNSDRFQQPKSLRIKLHDVRDYPVSQPPSLLLPLETQMSSNAHARSIKDLLKQWAGGALFGLVIFAGILLSQSEEEEAPQNFYDTHVVGLSLGR